MLLPRAFPIRILSEASSPATPLGQRVPTPPCLCSSSFLCLAARPSSHPHHSHLPPTRDGPTGSCCLCSELLEVYCSPPRTNQPWGPCLSPCFTDIPRGRGSICLGYMVQMPTQQGLAKAPGTKGTAEDLGTNCSSVLLVWPPTSKWVGVRNATYSSILAWEIP